MLASFFVRNLQIVLVNNGEVSVRKDFKSRELALKDSTASVNLSFSSCFDVSLAEEDNTFDSSSFLPYSSFGNFGVDFKVDCLAFDLA